jgi:hypothetical protein
VTGREIRVERGGLAEKGLGDLVLLRPVFVGVPETALIGLPGIEPFRRRAAAVTGILSVHHAREAPRSKAPNFASPQSRAGKLILSFLKCFLPGEFS